MKWFKGIIFKPPQSKHNDSFLRQISTPSSIDIFVHKQISALSVFAWVLFLISYYNWICHNNNWK